MHTAPAKIDFRTDKIIWVTFVPATSGSAVARVLCASPEIYWDRRLQGIEPLELRSPHDWYKGPLGTCHYAPPLGPPAYDDQAFRSAASFRSALGSDPSIAQRAEGHFRQSLRFVQTTHLGDATIARLFPRCQIVAVIDSEPLDFTIRAYHEKFNKQYYPMSLQKALWDGADLAEAIARSPVPVQLHEGVPLTGLQKHIGKIEIDNRDVRRLYRRIYADILAQMQQHTSRATTLVIDRAKLFDPQYWQAEYGAACQALQITPMTKEVTAFIHEYNTYQWHRPLPPRLASFGTVEGAGSSARPCSRASET